MWRWLSALSLLAALGAGAGEPSPSPGASASPAAVTEPERLWREGRAAYLAGDFDLAVRKLQPLQDRFVGYPDAHAYRELRFWLGRAYSGLGLAERAQPELRSYLEGAAPKDEAPRARALLGDAFVAGRKYEEAYLLSKELTASPEPEVRAEGLLLQTRAQAGMGQVDRADLALAEAEKLAGELKKPALLGKSAQLRLEMKTADCARLPAAKVLAEDQVIEQLENRGTCIGEALPIYRSALSIPDQSTAIQAQGEMQGALEKYWIACNHPPNSPSKRSSTQNQHYQAELIDHLRVICGKKLSTVQGILAGWQASGMPSSAPAMALPRIRELDQAVTRLLSTSASPPARKTKLKRK